MPPSQIDAKSGPRHRNPRGEGDRLREQLLDATTRLLEEKGDAAQVSLRAITKAAGVSPTALYLQFADRDAAIDAAVDRCFRRFNAAILDAAGAESEPLPRLRAMGLAYLQFAEQNPTLYAVLFSTRRPMRESRGAGDGPPVDRDEAYASLMQATAAAMPGAPEEASAEAAVMVWSSLHGYATLCPAQTTRRWPEPARYVERMVSGLLTG